MGFFHGKKNVGHESLQRWVEGGLYALTGGPCAVLSSVLRTDVRGSRAQVVSRLNGAVVQVSALAGGRTYSIPISCTWPSHTDELWKA